MVPLHPLEAVQLVALVEDHVRVELPPGAIDVGLAVKLKVGADVEVPTFTDALVAIEVKLFCGKKRNS